MRIKITKDGPYLVFGSVPIVEKIIVPQGRRMLLKDGKPLPQAESYALCRCGKSLNAPFCDGKHLHANFCGDEVACKDPYKSRLKNVVFGKSINLLDDGRCAMARFCHTEQGDTWAATEMDTSPECRAAAIKSAHECPAGRLVVVDKDGNPLEKENAPEIIVLQDPENNVSAGIFVKGPIVIEAADGTEYEVRNRQTLCRCGESSNKPFCDSAHITKLYLDK